VPTAPEKPHRLRLPQQVLLQRRWELETRAWHRYALGLRKDFVVKAVLENRLGFAMSHEHIT
jgi:hypothetical protein